MIACSGAEDDDDRFAQAAERYSSLFRTVTEEDIESFAALYKGSKEEKEDVVNFYNRCEKQAKKRTKKRGEREIKKKRNQ